MSAKYPFDPCRNILSKHRLSFLSTSIPQRIHEKTLKQIKQISSDFTSHFFGHRSFSSSHGYDLVLPPLRVLHCSGCLWSPVSRCGGGGRRPRLQHHVEVPRPPLKQNRFRRWPGAPRWSGRRWEGGRGWLRERCWGDSSFWKKTERCGTIQQLNFSKKNASLFLFHRCFCLEI